MRNTTIVLLIAAVTLGLLAGCKGKEGKSGKLTIAVIPKGTSHSFWKSVHAGAVKASKELGVEIIWKGAMKEDDLEGETKVVEDFIDRGVDGIVLAPLHHTALKIQVVNAKRSGIPTVIIDSGLDGDEHISFVATDNLAGGRMAGEHLARLLGGKGKVVMMRYQVGSASTENREKGFMQAIAKHDGIEVISSNQYGGPDISDSIKKSEDLMPKLREARGVYCPNETTTFGMLRALQDAGLAGKIKFVGFDSNPKLVEALKAGEINGLVLQDPINMGYMGVKTMVQHLRKQAIKKRVDTGCGIATPENMEDDKIKGLLNPDYKKWLRE